MKKIFIICILVISSLVAAAEDINVVCDKYVVQQFQTETTDTLNYYVTLSNEHYTFALDLYLTDSLAEDVVYTLEDCSEEYSKGGDYYTMNYIFYDSLSFSFTLDANQRKHVAATIYSSNLNVYHLTYDQDPLPVATDTVEVMIPNAQLTDYTASGVFQIYGYSADKDYYITLAFYSYELTGHYSMDDLYIDYSRIGYNMNSTKDEANILDIQADVTTEGGDTRLTGYVLGDNSICYHVVFTTSATALPLTESEKAYAVKRIENGRLVISRNGREYSADGAVQHSCN
ncbi:MAG: hypothetical protein MJZ82_00935 [Paludibacteraceae bacterium]|nr:hypothetical protein [Paludibacteraceae bacterium]